MPTIARRFPDGREIVTAGSYHPVAQTPVGFMSVVTAIPRGLVEASAVVVLVLLAGGSVGVLRRTGVIDLAIAKLVVVVGARVELVIPALMTAFGLVSAFVGTPELAIAYLPIVLPLMLRLGYDRVTATAVALVSTSLGFAFGITAPATIGVGHLLAELPMYSGAAFRAVSFAVVQLVSIAFVMRYARRVRTEPASSAPASVGETPGESSPRLTAGAVVTAVAFAAIIGSVLRYGLGLEELSGLFVVAAVVVSLTVGRRPNRICDDFNASFREMLTGALIVGVARGVSVVMIDGNILDTFVHYLAGAVGSLPGSLTAVGILFTQSAFNFLVPSGSGQCLLTLPILIPLGDLVGVTRQVVVLATHWGDGVTNVVFPTSGYFMATLVIGGVSWSEWLSFYLPLFWGILVLAASGLVVAQAIQLGPF